MATVLTEPKVDEGTVHVSFPILKWEQDEDGDLVVKGVATDGTLDSDEQVVSPEWSAKALDAWISTGGNVRMSHDPRRPVGKGLQVEVNKDGSGKHWVTSVIVDRDAQKLIKKGVLTAYSVGIARPVIKHDPTGKARGGIIVGGELCELSVVDRPSNKNSYLEIAKAAADGTCEFTGKVYGADDELTKDAGTDVTKAAGPADMSGFQMPADLDITFTPNDMARLMQAKVVEKHYAGLAAKATAGADTEKRDVGAAERRSLAGDHRALSDGSYPIKSHQDAANAVTLAMSGHGDAGAAKALIRRVAREEGWQDILDRLDGKGSEKASATAADEAKETVEKADAPEAQDIEVPEAAKEAEPEVTKDPEPEAKDKPVKKAKKKPKGGKKLPPWLNKPDEGSDDDKGSSGDDGACKSVTDHLWTGVEGTSDIECSKCHTTPAEAAGLSGTHDMTCAPVPELLESPPMASTKGSPTPQSASGAAEAPAMTPVPQHREPDGAIVEPFEKDAGLPATGQGETPTRLEAGMMKASPEVAAILRFKAAGIDAELGRVHDLTCPAYHPEDVAKCHPFADFRSVLDEGYFQRKAVEAACGPSLDRAKSLHLAWQAAAVLKKADPAELNDYRLAAHKAFRDANPGPSSAPTPGMVSPGKYNRPLITDGHSATSTGHDGPNTSPQVATSAPDAHSFDRPPLGAGHQTPSPSFMKASFEYPHETGRPVQLDYAVTEKERARHALMQMHEHLSRQFPEVCPMSLDAPPVQPERHPVPAAVGKGEGASAELVAAQVQGGVITPAEARAKLGLPDSAEKAGAIVAAFKAEPEAGDGFFADADVYKGFKKRRKKLGKRVLAGDMTVDEARADLGRRFAQKSGSDGEAAQKGVTYVTPGDPNMTPTQIRDLQDSLQKMAGESGSRIIVLPPGSKIGGPVGDTTPIHAVPLTPAPDALKAAAPPRPAPPPPVAASFGPEDIEAAVTKAVGPLLEKIQQQDDTYTTKLAEQQRVIDAIADQPDPSTAAFSGLAFNPVRKNARPAGVLSQAEAAERSQQMMIRHLTDSYNNATDPFEREGWYAALGKMRGGAQT